jgi:UDP-3-O-[3-hydroxymyristoyl] glucosamine N-acyltransferase
MPPVTLGRLAELVQGRLIGDASLPISGIAPIREARSGQVTFMAHVRHLRDLAATKASAVLVGAGHAEQARASGGGGALVVVEDPYFAMCQVMRHFYRPVAAQPGVSPHAAVSPHATVGRDVTIHPYVVVDDRAVIGDRVVLHAGCYVGADATIGEESLIYPRVTILERVQVGRRVIIHSGSVIGSDGFGYAFHEGEHLKIPQVGTVVIEDDVELGANVTVDRATLGQTVIGRGTKVDNLVQIAHNVTIGERSVIVAQAGISGSTTIGRGVVLAGQVGVVGHVTIGDGARVGAQSGVSKDVPPGRDVSGSPAVEHRQYLAIYATLPHLPEFRKRLHRLEEELHELQQQLQPSGRASRRARRPPRRRRA